MTIYIFAIVIVFIVLVFGTNYINMLIGRHKIFRSLRFRDKIYSCEFDGGGTYQTGSIIRDSIKVYEITNFDVQGIFLKRVDKIFTTGGQFLTKDYMQNGCTWWRGKDIDLFLDELEEKTILEYGELDNLQIMKDGLFLVRKAAKERGDDELVNRCSELIQNINLKIVKPS